MLNYNMCYSSVNNTNNNKYKYFNRTKVNNVKNILQKNKYFVELKRQKIIF